MSLSPKLEGFLAGMTARIDAVTLSRVTESWRAGEAYLHMPAESGAVQRLLAAGRIEEHGDGYRPVDAAANGAGLGG